MTWEAHTPHRATGETKPFYTYTLMDKDGEPYYAAYITQKDQGYQATVPMRGMKQAAYYHYTHDTLQEAKDWCIAELWKRRLE